MSYLTSREWIEYFEANHASWEAIPWGIDPGVTREEMTPILHSLQAWQLGETSEAKQLKAAARRYANEVGDPDYITAVDCFIFEEQRHGESLGRFLDAIGAERIRRDAADSVFRCCRNLLRNMECWTTVVIMIEVMAMIFYDALRRATSSTLLQCICEQILRDEVPHLRFQYERLAMMYAGRGRPALRATYALQRGLFLSIVLIVWFDNRRLIQAGGRTFHSYWSEAWRRMNACWRQTDPRLATSITGTRIESPSRIRGWLH